MLKAFMLQCNHLRLVEEKSLTSPYPRQLYCGICKDNQYVIDVLHTDGEGTSVKLPQEAEITDYTIEKTKLILPLSNFSTVSIFDVTMTSLIKDWETQNTYPGGFFDFYKAMQIKMLADLKISLTRLTRFAEKDLVMMLAEKDLAKGAIERYLIAELSGVPLSSNMPPRGYLINCCRGAIDDFLKTNDAFYLVSASCPLAILYLRASKRGL